AKEQIEVAEEAFYKGDYGLALKAANRTVTQWPLSDYAPRAQYLVGRCREAKGRDQTAFTDYQKLVEQYPKVENYQEVVERQHLIANKFLRGKFIRAWDIVPLWPSMDKTAEMYEKIIRNGPY